jgi:hypothetical protein
MVEASHRSSPGPSLMWTSGRECQGCLWKPTLIICLRCGKWQLLHFHFFPGRIAALVLFWQQYIYYVVWNVHEAFHALEYTLTTDLNGFITLV